MFYSQVETLNRLYSRVHAHKNQIEVVEEMDVPKGHMISISKDFYMQVGCFASGKYNVYITINLYVQVTIIKTF